MDATSSQPEAQKELLSPQEFAIASGFSLPTIRRYLEKGLLPKIQPCGKRGRVGIPRSALTIFARDEGVPGSALPPVEMNGVTQTRKRMSGPAPRWFSQTTNNETD